MELIPLIYLVEILPNIARVLENGPRRENTCLQWFSNNKGADQPAQIRSLISAFVIR